MPAPRSKPSRTTYPVIMSATSQNHTNNMTYLLGDRLCWSVYSCGLRTVPDLVMHEVQTENREDGGGVDKEGQPSADDQRIVDPLMVLVRLAKNYKWCASLGLEQTLHGRGARGLMFGRIFSVQVSGGKNLQDGKYHSTHHAYAQEDASLLLESSFQQVVRADGRHHKSPGDHGAAHVVRILQHSPGVQQQSPEAIDLESAVRHALVGYGMLHPRVAHDDEITGKPRAQKEQESRPPVHLRAETLFTV